VVALSETVGVGALLALMMLRSAVAVARLLAEVPAAVEPVVAPQVGVAVARPAELAVEPAVLAAAPEPAERAAPAELVE
jgi:hypothetical protein